MTMGCKRYAGEHAEKHCTKVAAGPGPLKLGKYSYLRDAYMLDVEG
jgi:hypothetical protein